MSLFMQISATNAQTLTIVPNPLNGTQYTIINAPTLSFTFNGKLYVSYLNASNLPQLAEWNGTALTFIPHPIGGVALIPDQQPIQLNGNIYLRYFNSSNKYQLAKFDGTTISLINNPSANDLGYMADPIVFNNELYLIYRSGNGQNVNQLAKYDGISTSVILISNANTTDYGCLGFPIVFNNELYVVYRNSAFKDQLAKYSGLGSSLTFINNASNTDPGYQSSLIVFNNELYFQYKNSSNKLHLAKYGGTGFSLTLISNANATDSGYSGIPIVYNSELYIQYINSSNNYQLAKYNGTGNSLTYISNATTTAKGYVGFPIIFNNELYIMHLSQFLPFKSQLAKYTGTGTALTFINNANTVDPGYWGHPIIFNNELCISYVNGSYNHQLAKYSGSGTTLSYVSNPNPNHYGFDNSSLTLNGNLYFRYDDNNRELLAKYDGTAITLYNNPDTGHGFEDSIFSFNNQVFIQYKDHFGFIRLAYLNTCPTTYGVINQSICQGASYYFNGITQTTGGVYFDTLVNAAGCDSIVTLNLTVTPQPPMPILACYETATFDIATCSWDVIGTPPTLPLLACYQTAKLNSTTCAWDVIGTAPPLPAMACYQTATFNNTICAWDVTGTAPIVTASNAIICPGGSVTLVGAPTGGNFSVPNPYSGTATTYSYTLPGGCGSATGTITLSSVAPALITIPIVAASTTAIVSWTAVSGSTIYYVWYKPVSASSSAWLTPTTSGTSLTLTGLVPNTLYEVKIRNNSATCNQYGVFGQSVQFTTQNSSCGAAATLNPITLVPIDKANISWIPNGSIQYSIWYKLITSTTWLTALVNAPATSFTTGTLPVGAYEVKIRNKCAGGTFSPFSSVSNFNIGAAPKPVSFTSNDLASCNLFPNPTTGILNAELLMLNEGNRIQVDMYDITGRLMRQVQTISTKGLNNMKMDLQDLPNGVYTLKVLENNQTTFTALVNKQN
jgi:hypothetical protein